MRQVLGCHRREVVGLSEVVAVWLVWFVAILALFSPYIRYAIRRHNYVSGHKRRHGITPKEAVRRERIGMRKSWDRRHGKGSYDRDVLGIEPPKTEEETYWDGVWEMQKRDHAKRKKVYDLSDRPPGPKRVRWRGT